MVQTQSIHVRLPKKLMEDLKKVIEKGYYSNLNDFIKESVREKVLNFEVPEANNKKEDSSKEQFHYVH